MKVLKEINYVSNQDLSIEMFLVQLIYLNAKKIRKTQNENEQTGIIIQSEKTNIKKIDAVSQIKNIQQIDNENSSNIKNDINNNLKNLDDIIKICTQKKEAKLKYELQTNVNLVSFFENRIEISFNEKLNKNFVKDLSEKLYTWTGKRWIISFSKEMGDLSLKEKQKITAENKIKTLVESKYYIKLTKDFPDIEVTDFKTKND